MNFETITRSVPASSNKQALARLIFELDDLARCDRTWFAWRRLRRLKKAIDKASFLATQPDIAERMEKILQERSVL